MSDDVQDLLEFGFIDVFYIAWTVNNKVYYLLDMTNDVQQINWTIHRSNAFYFYTEIEATKTAKIIQKHRPGIAIVPGEIDIIEDLELEDILP